MADVPLIVFARAPRAGHTKTRLIPALGPDGAARLYRAFLEDTLRLARSIDGFEVEVWVADPADQAFFGSCRIQVGDNLGARMSHALSDGLSRADHAVIIGTDAPTLPPSHLHAALRALVDSPASLVLGPSADGGYYLIGAGAPAPALRDVRWSSIHTLNDTIASAPAREVQLLSPWYDIDTPADLRLLRAHLALRPHVAPATLAILSSANDGDFDPSRRA